MNGPPNYDAYDKFARDPTNQSRTLAFSPNGKLFAWCTGQKIKIVSVPECTAVQEIDSPRATYICFSPKGHLIATWELYAPKKDAVSCNLHIYDVKTGGCLKSLNQKKQAGWRPQWTDDEKLVARSVNNEVHFFENNNFDNIHKKIYLQKVSDFSLAPGKAPYHVVCYAPGSKGQPSMVKLYQFPKFEGLSAVIASKTFFKGDKVDMTWNRKGSAVLVLASTDTDKSGTSYYGEQTLHLLTTSGDSSFVQLGKTGPIYSMEWSPQNTEFCVVYGFMPAKATLYNLKGDVTFDFGTSPRNLIFYNPFGNMLILGGFGNLNGHLEVWDLKQKKEICRMYSRDSTYLEWCPDGEHFMTATLSPRLRIGNGYRMFHYSGSLLHEVFCAIDEELWEFCWRPFLPGIFSEKKIVHTRVSSIASSVPEASKEAYRPPAARGLPASKTSKLHDDYEKPSNQKNKEGDPTSTKVKKPKAKKKPKKKEESESELVEPIVEIQLKAIASWQLEPMDDAERERQTKKLQKKLSQIHKLQELKTSGKKLSPEEVEKLKKEKEIIHHLKALQL